jgi:hypothetical protein
MKTTEKLFQEMTDRLLQVAVFFITALSTIVIITIGVIHG